VVALLAAGVIAATPGGASATDLSTIDSCALVSYSQAGALADLSDGPREETIEGPSRLCGMTRLLPPSERKDDRDMLFKAVYVEITSPVTYEDWSAKADAVFARTGPAASDVVEFADPVDYGALWQIKYDTRVSRPHVARYGMTFMKGDIYVALSAYTDIYATDTAAKERFATLAHVVWEKLP
jgi:hypothetical protein